MAIYIDLSDPTTVTDAAWKWLKAHEGTHSSGTQKRNSSLIKQHIAGTELGRRRLVRVTNTDVQEWVSERAAVLAPRTVKLAVQTIRAVFNQAVADRRINHNQNPATKLSLPKVPDRHFVPLTVAQVRTLAATAPEHARALVTAQAALGPRLGELLALRVKDVSFDFRTVRIAEQLSQDGKCRMPTKNHKERKVPMPNTAAAAVREHMATYPPATEDELIFTVNGLPWRQDQFDRVLRKAVREAKLPAGTTSHHLRHHYVSVLLDAGESVIVVAERIGDTPKMVTDVYGHLMPDSEDKTRRAIDAAWSADGQGTVKGADQGAEILYLQGTSPARG
jgi:integrase